MAEDEDLDVDLTDEDSIGKLIGQVGRIRPA